jgi:hypothetical protein
MGKYGLAARNRARRRNREFKKRDREDGPEK